jgi:hypothetical protein
MSTYQTGAAPYAETGRYDGRAAATGRPTTLTAAVGAAAGVAVLNLVSAIMILASATDMIRRQIAANPGFGGPAGNPDDVDMSGERARGLNTIFTSMASGMIFWALVLGVLAYFALRGGRTTRALATVILVVTAALKAIDLILTFVPTVVAAADVLVVVLALVAMVLFFLPASNAYGKYRRAARNRTAN